MGEHDDCAPARKAGYRDGFRAGLRFCIDALSDSVVQRLMLAEDAAERSAAEQVSRMLDAIAEVHGLDDAEPRLGVPE